MERIPHKEFPKQSLTDVVDELIAGSENIREIINKPRSFLLQKVSKRDLFAPTALPIEMLLLSGKKGLVATTGGSISSSTDFEIVEKWHDLAPEDREDRLLALRELTRLS